MDYIFLSRLDFAGAEEIDEIEAVRLVRDFCLESGNFEWRNGTPVQIRNSDGSISIDSSGRLSQGIARVDHNLGQLIPCYGFNGGICIHSDGSNDLMEFCQKLAESCNLQILLI